MNSQTAEIQMTHKHVKRCSVSIDMKEMQIKAKLGTIFHQ